MTRSRTELTAYAGIAGSVMAVAFVLAAPWHWMTLTGALVLACIPAGAAVMCWIDSGEGVAQAGLTLAVSLAVIALASSIMIWAAAWHPRLLLVLAGASAISCAARVWRTTDR
jgi:hypothetical protein